MDPIEEIMRRHHARQQEWSREYPQVNTVLALAPKKGNKDRKLHRVPVYRKMNRKLRAQIAFVQGGKPARDAIYPPRAVLFA